MCGHLPLIYAVMIASTPFILLLVESSNQFSFLSFSLGVRMRGRGWGVGERKREGRALFRLTSNVRATCTTLTGLRTAFPIAAAPKTDPRPPRRPAPAPIAAGPEWPAKGEALG